MGGNETRHGRDLGTDDQVAVVALVTSAGGLPALSAVLKDLPTDLPAAVVVAQHLGGQGSALVEILGRRCALPVRWAREGCPVEPGTVTVCPPRSTLEVLPDRTCSVRPRAGTASDRPLDALLTSLGDSVGPGALAVVLTGMGHDAAAGAAAVRAAGGVVLAQSEDTAEQPAMPRAAVGAGAVDLVLPLHELGRVVVDVVTGHPLPRAEHEEEAIRFTFGEDGEVAGLAREIDWASTPLGAVSAWPEAQRVVTRLAMRSSHGVTLYLGEQHIVLVNETGVPLLGGHLRRVFARPYAEAYPEAVDYMVPVLTRVLAGERVYHEATLVPFVRRGRLENAWFDMSYTLVAASDGTVVGVQQTFLDRTDEVLGRRRLQLLNRLAALAAGATRAEAVSAAVDVLAEAEDVPFAAAYLVDLTRLSASLAATCGAGPGRGMAPHLLRLTADAAWPLRRVVRDGAPVVLDDVADRFRGQRVTEHQLSLEQAVLHPLRGSGKDDVVGVLVLGVHPRLPLTEGYREFLRLVAEAVAARAQEADARQRERDRLERLAELDRAKTEFFSNVSHEFRTPLTLMLGPLDDMLQHGDDLPPQRKADLELVRRSARRLLRLVATMLDFSQIEAGRQRARFAPVDLAARTREVVAQFETAATQAGLALRVDLEELPERVWVDVEMWEKILSNLLSNALKFTFEGEIAVSLRALRKHVELVVRDTGVGVPEDELPHLFQRFHRVRGTRARTYEGAGIGLALADELVRRHHGRIRAASTLGEGTAFTVWLPLGRRPAFPDAPVADPPPTTTVAAAMAEEALRWGASSEPVSLADDDRTVLQSLWSYAPGARVLVVDDNRDMRDYLSRLLTPYWHAQAAPDGAEALALARADPPDLVLTDVLMPGLDGFALLRELRADPALAATPVVLVTARAGEESAIEGLLAGADDYLVKPFSARELVARVGGQLELARVRRRAAELDAFRVGLSDALRSLSDAEEIQQTACRLLVEQLGAGRARFVEVRGTDEALRLWEATRDGGARTRRPGRLETRAAQEILAGRRLVVDHARRDAQDDDERQVLADVEVGAALVVPVTRGGGARAALVVLDPASRRWSPDEVALAEEVAGRTWTEVERASSAAALRKSEERMRRAMSVPRVGVLFFRLDGTMTEANDAFQRMSGYSDAELRSTAHWDTLTAPEFLAVTEEHALDLAARGETTPYEKQMVRPDGTRWWGLFAPTRLGGRDRGSECVEFVIDITAEKQAQQALRESEERQAFLLWLSDALRPLVHPAAIKAVATRVLGEHLGVNRAFYAEMVDDEWVVDDGYTQGIEPLETGVYAADVYGRWTMDTLLGRGVVAIDDTRTDARLGELERRALQAIGAGAVVGVPLYRDERVVAVLSLHQRTARAWTDHEIGLVQETADRTWYAVGLSTGSPMPANPGPPLPA